MDEPQWLASRDAEKMFGEIMGPHNSDMPRQDFRLSDRKMRLLATALSHVIGADFKEMPEVWQIAERMAEGLRNEHRKEWCFEFWVLEADTRRALSVAVGATRIYHGPAATDAFRDVIGNPYRANWLPPNTGVYVAKGKKPKWGWIPGCAWRTPQAVSLADDAYVNRLEDGTLDPFTLMALADALEEAGCDSERLLRHLRGWRQVGDCDDPSWRHGSDDVAHYKGCWAVDLVLGKG